MERLPELENKQQRSLSIDVFRGITIAAMMFVNTAGIFYKTPAWSRHPVDYGFTYVDLVAPFFIIAISLTYHISFMKRYEKYGMMQTILQFLRRYVALLGFGFLGSPIISSNRILFQWGVLQAIGFAGIITLFFINIKKWLRLGIACLFLIIYQIAQNFSVILASRTITLSNLILASSHGGIIGGIGWALLMIIATVVGELFEEKKNRHILILGTLFSIVGIISSFFWGISKHRVNFPYISTSIGFGALFLCMIWYILDYRRLYCCKKLIFRPMGRNAFVLYIIHAIILVLIELIVPASISWVIIILIGLINMMLLWLCAYYLDKKNIYLII